MEANNALTVPGGRIQPKHAQQFHSARAEISSKTDLQKMHPVHPGDGIDIELSALPGQITYRIQYQNSLPG